MGVGASAQYVKCVEDVGSDALTTAYGNLEVDDKKAFRKTFKKEGLAAAIEGANDEVKAAFEDVSEENRTALADSMREVLRRHAWERFNKKRQEKIDALQSTNPDLCAKMQEKLNARKEAGPPEPLSKEERKENIQKRHDETVAKAAEAEEAGQEKKAARLKSRAERMQKFLERFDEDSDCPSECDSCIEGSHSDCDDGNICEACEAAPAEE